MAATPQRQDIAEVVERFTAARGEPRFESLAPAPDLGAQRAVPLDPLPGKEAAREKEGDAWYVVIDEIVEATVTYEAWPWPTIDAATRFLSFDLDRTRRKTVDLDELQAIVDRLRAEQDASATKDRPLRIGDVFEVVADKIRDPSTWSAVVDDTRSKRKAAQAALYAMATPPHFTTSHELEEIGRSIEAQEPRSGTGSTRAFPAV